MKIATPPVKSNVLKKMDALHSPTKLLQIPVYTAASFMIMQKDNTLVVMAGLILNVTYLQVSLYHCSNK